MRTPTGRDDYARYGMKSDDWRHLDAYWREMYRMPYPRGDEPWMESEATYGLGGPRAYELSAELSAEGEKAQLQEPPYPRAA